MTKQELDEAVNARLGQIESALAPIPDETAAKISTLFPVWGVGVEYPLGYKAQYDRELYRCEQTHVSQDGWEPPNVPALWTKIPKPGEIPVWNQPTGAQDAYMKGDRVHYPDKDGPVYVSTVDNNVWAPTVYGWDLEG